MMRVITFDCDACERTLEMSEKYAGEKVACPYCGDVNIVPLPGIEFDPEADGDSVRDSDRDSDRDPAFGTDSEAARNDSTGRVNRAANSGPARSGPKAGPMDRAEAAGLPPDSGPERTVMLVRPVMFRARPVLFGAELLATLGGLGLLVWGLATGEVLFSVGGAVLCLLGAIPLLIWWIDRLGASLRITNKRTIERRGLLSRATSEVMHDNIRNVQIKQSFWQRLWSVGELGISSSGQDGIEIVMNNLPNPDKIRKTIDLYRPM